MSKRLFLAPLLLAGACAAEEAREPPSLAPDEAGRGEVVREADAARGRALFVDKGCVVCHAVNGVGGKAAMPLDAPSAMAPLDTLGFAARMWRGAPAMIELQNLELGYTIWLEAQEMADLAAFASNSTEQKNLQETDVPEPMRALILDERYWEAEDWSEFLRQGQEGYGEPEAEDAPD